VGGDVPVDSEMLLVINFVNLKIKLAQSFGGAHRGRVYVHVFIGVSARMHMSICVYPVFLQKKIEKASCAAIRIIKELKINTCGIKITMS
jgi:hypothetical protein